jgi:D-alanyl-D-alanine carboxypeptidase
MSDLKKPTGFLIFVSCLTVFFVAVFFFSIQVLKPKPLPAEQKVAQTPQPSPVFRNPFEHLILEGEAVYVFDARTGKTLFSKNEEASLPLASLTKVMTALVASGVSENTSVASLDGEKWNLKELLDYTLVVSSNNGASAIAGAGGALLSQKTSEPEMGDEEIFIQKMNEEARALHLAQTFYLNPSGLDVTDTLSGAYGSAKDMALLFAHILKEKPALMEATAYDSLRFRSLDGTSYAAENTNIVARTIPGLLASKTGYTNLAGGNLVIAFDAGPAHPIIVSVLGSTQEGRFTDVEKLVKASVEKIGQGE